MSLRIVVFGKSTQPGLSGGREILSMAPSRGSSADNHPLTGNKSQWISVPAPLSAEGISCLQHAHGCWVVLPNESVRDKDIQAGLSEDFRELRACRGKEVLPGGMPVLLDLPETADCQSPEMVRWVEDLNRELGHGFGSFHFSLGCQISQGHESTEIKSENKKWLELARDYRRRSVCSNVRAMFTVFCLAWFLFTLIGGAILLLRNTDLEDWGRFQRLEYGLNSPRDFLFQANSLEPLAARLEDLQVFLDSHPNLPEGRRIRLEIYRERLIKFVNTVLETRDWATVSDVSDMAGLKAVAQSLAAWNPPQGSQVPMPLVEKAEAKRHLVLDAWTRAQEMLPVFEERLSKAEQLLNPRLDGPESWNVWANDCSKFIQQLEILAPEDPLCLLDEFMQARQSILDRKKTLAGAVGLASGLGLLPLPNHGTRSFFPGSEKGKAMVEITGIWDQVLEGPGRDAGAFFLKLGPGLAEPFKFRCAECRKDWLKIGRTELAETLRKGGASRHAFQKWGDQALKSPPWEEYGRWLEWLGAFDFKRNEKNEAVKIQNPVLALHQYFAQEVIVLRPSRCLMTLPKEDSEGAPEFVFEVTVLGAGAKSIYLADGVRVGPRSWEFRFLFQDRDKPEIAWQWNESLRLVLKEKTSGKILREITAANPVEGGELMGDSFYGLEWQPMNAAFPLPELLVH